MTKYLLVAFWAVCAFSGSVKAQTWGDIVKQQLQPSTASGHYSRKIPDERVVDDRLDPGRMLTPDDEEPQKRAPLYPVYPETHQDSSSSYTSPYASSSGDREPKERHRRSSPSSSFSDELEDLQ